MVSGLLLITFLLGFAVVNLSDGFETSDSNTLALNCLVSVTLGVGLSSCTYFWGWVLFGQAGLFWVLDGVVLAGLFAASPRLRAQFHAILKRLRAPATWGGAFRGGFSLDSVLLPIVVFFLAVIATNLFNQALTSPHGRWDAWAIWNAHARFLARDDVLGTVFSELYSFSHPDYPLLLPASVARIWSFLGQETQYAPILLGVAFTTMTVALLYFGVAWIFSPIWAVLGVLVLIAHSGFLSLGVSQYADTPLGLYFLLTLLLYAIFDLQEEKRVHLAAIGALSMSMAAWTKNEGMLFIVLVLSARVLKNLISLNWNETKNEALATVLGLVPIGLTLVVFKAFYAPKSDLLSRAPDTLFEKLGDLSRYQTIFEAGVQRYQEIGVAVLALMAGLAVFSLLRRREAHPALLTPVLVLIGMHLGYFFVYVTTPNDLTWHINTSMSRLVVQLWPAMVFTFMLLVPSSLPRSRSLH